MPLNASQSVRRRVAVIGAGISGMGSAYFLSDTCDVTLFEAGPRLGGHARTRIAGVNGDQPVDTGFIVFNKPNYPLLTRLFDEIKAPVTESDMSFSASIDGGRLEYGLATPKALFAQPKNALNPRFWGMIRDVLKFNKQALDAARDPSVRLGDFLDDLGMGQWFRDYYLLPLSGAIWSTPTEKILDFPAHALVRFFENHALLHHSGQHQWYTVKGGSIEYVTRLEASLRARGVEICLNAPVEAIKRPGVGADLRCKGAWDHFDAVVMATHSDDSLRLLSDPSAEEQTNLSAIAYQPNRVVLHGDTSIMPRRKACWAAWNYVEARNKQSDCIDLTYWMNKLQPIPESDPLFVTLNSTRPIRPELIYDEVILRHPVYDRAALDAQRRIALANGTRDTWFCGAWVGNGFHEDGLASALSVSEALVTSDLVRAA